MKSSTPSSSCITAQRRILALQGLSFIRRWHCRRLIPLISVIASKTFLFEVIASLALPAGMIHGIVHSTEAIIHHTFPSPEQLASVTRKEIQSLKLSQIARSYGPTTLGLLSIPFMPMVGRCLFVSSYFSMRRSLTDQSIDYWIISI